MTMRVCNVPGCPELVEAGTRDGRCLQHRREREKARGTRKERGYGAEHQRLRQQLLPTAYGQPCQHCGERMWPHQELHLDHTEDRTGYRGIVHAHCNTSEAATRGHRQRGEQP
jgi:hypothetical protein